MAYEKKDPEQQKADMDAATAEAQNDLPEMVDLDKLEESGAMVWWGKWVRKAGHRRLYRAITKGL